MTEYILSSIYHNSSLSLNGEEVGYGESGDHVGDIGSSHDIGVFGGGDNPGPGPPRPAEFRFSGYKHGTE